MDVYDEDATALLASGGIKGFAGAAGVVEGTARVITSVADVGAPLSHATIVARELGIPAVVGTGNATRRVRDGDRVRGDGGNGTVEVIST